MLTCIKEFQEIPVVDCLAVIINCGTKLSTTLALASILKNVSFPVLLIDCESKDGSVEHFLNVQHRLPGDFFLLRWPLRRHGAALDALFSATTAQTVLLVDSDVEVTDGEVIRNFQQRLSEDENSYGAGYRHGPNLLDERHGIPSGTAIYMERMWIPLVLLKTEAVRSALRHRQSFLAKRAFVEYPDKPNLSALLAKRFRIVGLRKIRPRIEGPVIKEFDTGASMHAWLEDRGFRFMDAAPELHDTVRHFHGVTRAVMKSPFRRTLERLGVLAEPTDAPGADATTDVLIERLAACGVIMPGEVSG